MFFIIPRRASKALLYMTNQQMNRCLKDLCEICGFNTPYTITYYKNNVRHDEVKPKYELIGTHAGCRDEIHRPLRLQIHEALHRHRRKGQDRRHGCDGQSAEWIKHHIDNQLSIRKQNIGMFRQTLIF